MLERLKLLFAASEDGDTENNTLLIPSAAAILLFEVAWADHDISEAEIRQVEQALANLFKLGPEQVSELTQSAREAQKESISMYSFTREINDHFDIEQKFELLTAMWQLALADEDIHKYEEHTIRNIADLLYISHRDFIRSKLRAKKAQNQLKN